MNFYYNFIIFIFIKSINSNDIIMKYGFDIFIDMISILTDKIYYKMSRVIKNIKQSYFKFIFKWWNNKLLIFI